MSEFSYHFFFLLFLLSSLCLLSFFSLFLSPHRLQPSSLCMSTTRKPPPPRSELWKAPNPTQTTSTDVPAAVPLKVFKIEPKAEPYDDPMVESTTPQPIDPSPSSYIFTNSQTTPAPQTSDNVYSEFHRISELFHTAFAKGIQNYDGVDDVVLDPKSGAIIAVEESKQKQLAEVVQRKKYPQRSNELVRVTDLSEEDHRYFREVVRKARMLYDAIQIILVVEEDKENPGLGKQEKAEREEKAAERSEETEEKR